MFQVFALKIRVICQGDSLNVGNVRQGAVLRGIVKQAGKTGVSKGLYGVSGPGGKKSQCFAVLHRNIKSKAASQKNMV